MGALGYTTPKAPQKQFQLQGGLLGKNLLGRAVVSSVGHSPKSICNGTAVAVDVLSAGVHHPPEGDQQEEPGAAGESRSPAQ